MLFPVAFSEGFSSCLNESLAELAESRSAHLVKQFKNSAKGANLNSVFVLLPVEVEKDGPNAALLVDGLPKGESCLRAEPALVLGFDHGVEFGLKFDCLLLLFEFVVFFETEEKVVVDTEF